MITTAALGISMIIAGYQASRDNLPLTAWFMGWAMLLMMTIILNAIQGVAPL